MKNIKKLVVIIATITCILTPTITVCAKETAYPQKSAEAQILKGINAERKAAGLSELRHDPDMDNGADIRAAEIVKKWSHTRPDGSEYWTADKDNIYGENLSKDFTSVNDIVDSWMDSPSHRDNVLFKDFKTCAISTIKTTDGRYYVAVEFGY